MKKYIYNPYLTALIVLVTVGILSPNLVSAKNDEAVILGISLTVVVVIYAVKSIKYHIKKSNK